MVNKSETPNELCWRTHEGADLLGVVHCHGGGHVAELHKARDGPCTPHQLQLPEACTGAISACQISRHGSMASCTSACSDACMKRTPP